MNIQEPINILLSQEELRLVLNLLQTNFIPGLDDNLLEKLTPEQQSLALAVAGRALRARELARVQQDGELAVHNALLTAVGVCAYPQNAIFIYHWLPGDNAPTRYFGHIRENDIVAHTRPQDGLHLFSLLPSKEQLIAQVLAVCEYESEDRADFRKLSGLVPGEDFVNVRELAEAGEVDRAVDLLVSNQVTPEAAQAFAETLAASPRVSIIQTLKQQGNETAQRDFTLVQNGRHAWLITPTLPDASLQIKTTTQDEIRALLAEWL